MKPSQIFPYLKEFRSKSEKIPINHVRIPQRQRASPSQEIKDSESRDAKEQIKVRDEQKRNHKELDALVTSSQIPLFNLSAVFPFDFFPDQISIEPSQVNIMNKSFFFTYQIQSIPIKNVADVFLQTSVFFATLKIIDNSYIQNSAQIEYLRKDEAIKARKIIQGLVVASKEGIDISGLPPQQLVQKIEQLGHARDVDIIR